MGMSTREFLKLCIVGGGATALLAGCGTREPTLTPKQVYESVIERVDNEWHHFVEFPHRERIKDVVRNAYSLLMKAPEERVSVEGNTVTVNLALNGTRMPLVTTLDQYLLDVASGFMSSEIDNRREDKLTGLLAHNYNDEEGVDELASRVHRQIPHRANTLSGSILRAASLIDFLVENSTYKFDQPSGRLSSFFNGQKGTKYCVPFRGFTFDYFKSTPQFFIDGTGDCDDYTTTAATLLCKGGMPAHYVSMKYPQVKKNKVVTKKGKVVNDHHAVVGLELTRAQYEALGDFKTYLGLVAQSFWDDTVRRFDGNEYPSYTWDNYELDSTLRIVADGKPMLLMEPQSRSKWKGFGVMEWDERFNDYMAKNTRFDTIVDVRNGRELGKVEKWNWRGKQVFDKVVVHRDGKVEFFENEAKYLPHTFQC